MFFVFDSATSINDSGADFGKGGGLENGFTIQDGGGEGSKDGKEEEMEGLDKAKLFRYK